MSERARTLGLDVANLRTKLRWSDDDLRCAIVVAESWADLAALLGYEKIGGSTKQRIRVRAYALELDLSRLNRSPGPQRRWSDDELAGAIARSSSWAEASRKLGLATGSSLPMHAKRLGLEVSHLDAAHRGLPPEVEPVAVSYTPNALRNAAETLAISWYTLHGYVVYTPPAGNPIVDLLVEHGESLRRVQVKSTTYRSPNGRWVLQTRRSAGGGMAKVGYTSAEVDEVFAVASDGRFWLIPTDAIENMAQVVLGSKYDKYQVVMFADAMDESVDTLRSVG